MRKTTNKYLTTAKIIVLALILSVGISVVYAQWSGPTAAPFGGNTQPPINIGNASQTKAGFFWAAGLGSTLGAFINGLLETATIRISGGSPAAGDVLTATNVQGDTTWATPSLSCVQRNETNPVGFGDVTADCLPGEVLTGGFGTCGAGGFPSNTYPNGNSVTTFCGSTDQEASATAICCTMNFPTVI